MAYSTPRTWSTGDDITAARLNQDLRDNPAFLATPPSCRVFKSTAFSHNSSGNYLAVTFDSERFDTDTMHSTSLNTSRLTATTAGKYLIGGNVEFAASATGIRSLAIRLNGTTYIASVNQTGPAAGSVEQMAISTYYALSASDYVELMAYQSTGGTLSVASDPNIAPEFWAVWQSL